MVKHDLRPRQILRAADRDILASFEQMFRLEIHVRIQAPQLLLPLQPLQLGLVVSCELVLLRLLSEQVRQRRRSKVLGVAGVKGRLTKLS